jgi:hypothetical protein
VFDPSKLERLSKIYDLDTEVKVVTHMTLMTHVGLDKHISELSESNETAINQDQTYDISKETGANNEEITSKIDVESRPHHYNASQVSEASPEPEQPVSEEYSFSCYYCIDFKTNDEKDYKRHVINKHPKKRAYLTKLELERLGLKPQGKSWET